MSTNHDLIKEKLLGEEVTISRKEVKTILLKLQKDNPKFIKAIGNLLLYKYQEVYKYFVKELNRLKIDNKGQLAYMILNDINEIPLCKDCGINQCNFKGFNIGYTERCTKCGFKYGGTKSSQTIKEKYGVSNACFIDGVKEKKIETNIRKHGVFYPMQSKEILSKSIKKHQENGGLGFANKKYKEKIDQTMIEKTGKTLNEYNGDPDRIRNMKNRSILKYGVDTWLKTKIAREYFHNLYVTDNVIQNVKNFLLKYDFELVSEYYNAGTPITIKHIPCGTEWTISCYNQFQTGMIIPLCRHCNPHVGKGVSSQEIMITEAIKKEFPNINIVNNTRTLIDSYKEIDIYLPDYHLGVEFCGLYWHSSNVGCNDIQKPKNNEYHKEKFLTCYNKGIRLLTIFEDEPLDMIINSIIAIIKNQEVVSIDDLEKFKLENGDQCYLLDNRFMSYNFFPLKNQFELVKYIPPIPWFWETFEHDFIRYDDFRDYYCDSNENVFKIAKQFNYNWIYDCGYQVIRKI